VYRTQQAIVTRAALSTDILNLFRMRQQFFRLANACSITTLSLLTKESNLQKKINFLLKDENKN